VSGAIDGAVFLQRLQLLEQQIGASGDTDDIMLNLSAGLCELFGADRLSIYALAPDQASLVSKVKTGLTSFKQLKLPITADSIAGYAALSRRMLNLLDVYDEAELARHSPELRFQQGVDKRTGYRTQQMLVAPIVNAAGVLMGVIQLINYRHGSAFPPAVEEGVRRLSDTLGQAFARVAQAPAHERGRFAALLPESVLPRSQLELAMRAAQTHQRDIEDVLIDEFGIRPALVGRALADFFSVPYFTFEAGRRRPQHLLEQFDRAGVLKQQWMPLEEGSNGLFILSVDPDKARAGDAVASAFPGITPLYCVTTRREFAWMTEQFFGAPAPAAAAAAAPVALPERFAETVGQLAQQAYQQGIGELHITTAPGDSAGEIRFTVSGVFRANPVR
jgi:hypothetical protein